MGAVPRGCATANKPAISGALGERQNGVSTGLAIVLLSLTSLIVMVAVGVLVYRDLTVRGVDPVSTILWLFFLWPVGLYLWMTKRNDNPHPTLH